MKACTFKLLLILFIENKSKMLDKICYNYMLAYLTYKSRINKIRYIYYLF